jgi:hypothetical protein
MAATPRRPISLRCSRAKLNIEYWNRGVLALFMGCFYILGALNSVCTTDTDNLEDRECLAPTGCPVH